VTGPELMTPREVREAFRVGEGTVIRWRKDGLLDSVLTPGGTHRYFRAQVEALRDGSTAPRQVTP
jgi:predicted site-specific integrase-resolvase